MTTWKDGGQLGQLREIAGEDGHTICLVLVQRAVDGGEAKPWPEGEEAFALILQAPVLLEALEIVWNTRQSASYEERNEAGVTGYAFYLTESQCAQIRTAIAAVKGE